MAFYAKVLLYMNNRVKVMVFGVFDGIHDGHRFFLTEAQYYGTDLTIVVTLDDTVKWLKEVSPQFPLTTRIKNLEKEYPRATVIPGDGKSNVWNVIKEHTPDVIVLGYDQNRMEKALYDMQLKFGFEIKKVEKNFKGKTLHSSLLREK